MHLHKGLRTKLEPQALRCVFVGYALHQKGYRCYHPHSRKLYVTFDVVFHENDMYYSESSLQGENRDEVQTLHHPLDNLDFKKVITWKLVVNVKVMITLEKLIFIGRK